MGLNLADAANAVEGNARKAIASVKDWRSVASRTPLPPGVSFHDKWRAIFHAMWRMDAGATTGSRQLVPIKCGVPWVERCYFLLSDSLCF
jgi:hypothetical protein